MKDKARTVKMCPRCEQLALTFIRAMKSDDEGNVAIWVTSRQVV